MSTESEGAVQAHVVVGDEDHKRLADDGWVVMRGVLSDASIATAGRWLERSVTLPARLKALEAQFDAADVPRKLRRIYWAEPAFWARWICDSGLRDVVLPIVGCDAALIFHAAFLKPANVGSSVGFHQDQALWEAQLPGAYSFWMPFELADSTNGGITVCSGSHRNGLRPHSPDPSHPWHDVVDPAAAGLECFTVTSAPGDVVVWDRYLVHGSDVNKSARSRRAMVVVFAPDNQQMRIQAKDHAALAEIERCAAGAEDSTGKGTL